MKYDEWTMHHWDWHVSKIYQDQNRGKTDKEALVKFYQERMAERDILFDNQKIYPFESKNHLYYENRRFNTESDDLIVGVEIITERDFYPHQHKLLWYREYEGKTIFDNNNITQVEIFAILDDVFRQSPSLFQRGPEEYIDQTESCQYKSIELVTNTLWCEYLLDYDGQVLYRGTYSVKIVE